MGAIARTTADVTECFAELHARRSAADQRLPELAARIAHGDTVHHQQAAGVAIIEFNHAWRSPPAADLAVKRRTLRS